MNLLKHLMTAVMLHASNVQYEIFTSFQQMCAMNTLYL